MPDDVTPLSPEQVDNLIENGGLTFAEELLVATIRDRERLWAAEAQAKDLALKAPLPSAEELGRVARSVPQHQPSCLTAMVENDRIVGQAILDALTKRTEVG